jgi:hypothetical protein
MRRFSIYIFTALLFSVFFSFPHQAFAIAKFNTKFQNYYRVDSDGNTHVSFVIDQINNLSVVYATDFGLNINETKVSNVKVSDEGIIIIPDVVKTLNQTTISFTFANKVVGKDKDHSFIIEYDTTDIATKFGNTWQVNIPKLESDENVSSQTVVLSVPENFPVPAYIDPKPDTIDQNAYYFTSNSLGNKAISAVFGQTQYYQGKLTYHLSNSTPTKSTEEIALPPDTAYQTVFYKNIDPKPESITTDEDGNYLAKYLLNPGANLDVNLDIYIKLNFSPRSTVALPSDKLLQANSIWNYDNGVFTTPEMSNLVSAKSIYDFVVDKMKYDYSKVNRQQSQKVPAAESLINSQSAICTDFTNVFVSLARKAGIPSRELEGYAISENSDLKPISTTQDVLHSWPEYFNRATNIWTQVDPTWANTTRGIDYFNKLDFNHIVFVIHGLNSSYPVPAGGYKKTNVNSKDISLLPTDSISFPDPQFTLKMERQINHEIYFQIDNSQGVSYTGKTITSQTDYVKETEQSITVPPFGTTELKISLKKQPIWGSIKTKAIIYLNGNPYEQFITIDPVIPQAALFALGGLILAVFAFFARHLHLRRQKQKTTLYR